MSHESLREKLLDLAYGELSNRDARKVEAHAASCDSCRAELARIRETRGLMAALPQETAPEGGENVLMAAARERPRLREPVRGFPAWLLRASVVAASLVAVAAVSYRIIAWRPGPLGGSEHEALLGDARPVRQEESRVAAAPPPPPDEARGDVVANHRAEEHRPAAPRSDAEKRKEAEPFREREAEPKAAPQEPQRFAQVPPPAAGYGAASGARVGAIGGASVRLGKGPQRPSAAVPAAPSDVSDKRQAEPPAAASAFAPSEPPGTRAAPSAAPRPPSAAAAPPPRTYSGLLGFEAPAPEGEAASGVRRATAPGAPAPRTGPAEDDAVARWASLRAAGKLRTETRSFSGCDPDGYDPHHFKESFRKLERDPEGRVVRYEMRGSQEGGSFEAEGFYDAAGVLRVERWSFDGRRTKEIRHPASGPAATRFPTRAGGATIDAPGLCDR